MSHGIKGPAPAPGQPHFGLPVLTIKMEVDSLGNVRTIFSKGVFIPQIIKIFVTALMGQADYLLQQQSMIIDPTRSASPIGRSIENDNISENESSEAKPNGVDKTETC